ncbi:Uma2 family endonuclease [Scytonema sp. UIC 10036]|uniref:Uma2 family endonuclease n=1 Tax=Scytonema sp. UIC 10036 TaxID=2304196 RepID=UPI0012DAA303|nr:Uma2 family endonuclease [Scytonema sp. UIC 10036]MUG96270.1 Uma2 family endonuclease [Scytonema sp. UIC 10036]
MDISLLDRAIEEKLVTLRDVSWEQFKGIEAQLIDNRSVRLSYLSGILEIMSPVGLRHERVKSTLGLLLEAYMKVLGIRFYRSGGFTIEKTGYASGTPDESYCIGTDKETPDIVIEVIITSGTIDRRQLYKPKQVPEVWFWKSDTIRIFHLNDKSEYEEVERSSFFPNLDPNALLPYIAMPDQYDAVQEFEQFLRSKLP